MSSHLAYSARDRLECEESHHNMIVLLVLFGLIANATQAGAAAGWREVNTAMDSTTRLIC
jgi:hypothetical protein